jgi:hypothetical protein
MSCDFEKLKGKSKEGWLVFVCPQCKSELNEDYDEDRVVHCTNEECSYTFQHCYDCVETHDPITTPDYNSYESSGVSGVCYP